MRRAGTTLTLALLATACGASRPPAPATALPPASPGDRYVRLVSDLAVEVGEDESLQARMLVGPGGLSSDRVAVAWFQVAEDHVFGAAHPCFDLHGVVLSGEADLLDPRGATRVAAGDALFVPRRYPFVLIANGGPVELLQVFASTQGVRACDDSVRQAEQMLPPEDREGLVATQHFLRGTDAPWIPIGGGKGRVQMLVDREVQGATLAYMGRFAGEPGLSLPTHAHDDSEEVLLVRSGRGTLTIDGERIGVRGGMVVHIPPRTEHSLVVDGDEPLRAVQVYAGPGPEERFRAARDAAGL